MANSGFDGTSSEQQRVGEADSSRPTVQSILHALRVQYDPRASATDRQLALLTLERLLDCTDAPMVGHELFHQKSGLAEEIRFFGLRCLENALKYKWNDGSFDLAARVQIRGLIEDALMTGMQGAGDEKQMIKEKLASLWVELAKREWPHNWDLNDGLRRAFVVDANTQEVVFLILKGLAEDIYDIDYVDEVAASRKKVLMQSLNSIVLTEEVYSQQVARNIQPLTKIAKEVIYVPPPQDGVGWFTQIVLFIKQILIQWQQQNTFDARTTHLLASALRSLSTFLPWISAKMLTEASILIQLCAILVIPSSALQLITAECIYLTCYRSYSSIEETSALFTPMFEGGTQYLLKAIQQLSTIFDNHGDEDSFTATKLLTQALVEVGERHLCWKKNITWIPPNLSDYMNTLIKLHQHPSLLISIAPLPFWLAALKHDIISRSTELMAHLPLVLAQAVSMLQKVHPKSGTLASRYARIDFNSSREIKMQLASQVNQLRSILRLIASAKPNDTFAWLNERLQPLLFQQNGGLVQQSDDDTEEAITVSRILRSYLLLLEIIGPILAQQTKKHNNVSLTQNVLITLRLFVENFASEPQTAMAMVNSIAALAYFLKFDTALLHLVLQKVIELSVMETYDHIFLRDLRYMALGSLVKFAEILPNNLMQIFDQLRDLISNLCIQGTVRYADQHYLQEFLAVTVLSSDESIERKLTILHSIVEPIVTTWLTDTITALQSMDAFVSSVGITFLESADPIALSTLSSEYKQVQARRQKLLVPAVASNALLKRYTTLAWKDNNQVLSFWQAYSANIIATSLQLISALHQLRQPETLSSFSADTKSVIALPRYLRRTYLQTYNNQELKQDERKVGFQTYLEQTQHFLEQIQPTLYTLLGQIAVVDNTVYARLPDLPNAIVSSLFSNTSHIADRHWTALLKCFLQPFVQHCPTEQKARVLGVILPTLLAFLRQKLDREWTQYAANNMGAEEDDSNDIGDDDNVKDGIDGNAEVTEEIYAERQLRQLTYTLVDMIASWTVPKGTHGHANKRTLTSEPKSLDLFISAPSVMEPLLFSVLSVMHYRDTQSVHRGISVMKHLTPLMIAQTELRPFIATQVVQFVLQALREGYHKNVHDTLISYLVQIVKALKDVNTMVFQTFLNVGVPLAKLEEAYKKLHEETDQKEAIMKDLLSSITGVSVAESGKREKSFAVSHVNKVLIIPSGVQATDNDVDYGDLFDDVNALNDGV